MHMADSLLSPAVGTAMCAVSAAAIAFSVAKIKKDDLCEKKVPITGVMGAFVFAAQMINITIPGTGSSGHIGGGILLAAMLGASPALLALSAVLIIQCLFFADGGLLALGCNIFNMGIIPCLIAYPLIYKPLIKGINTAGQSADLSPTAPSLTTFSGQAFPRQSRGVLNPSFPHSLSHVRASTNATSLHSSIKTTSTKRISLASIAATLAALQLGALSVVLETRLSGITELPFGTFLLLMQPIHLAIGIVEGIISAAILCFVHKMRPEIMESAYARTAMKSGVSYKKILISLAIITLLTGGVLSLFVSTHPDGLEWSIEKITGKTELKTESRFLERAASIQEKTALMPDYDFRDEENSRAGASVAGIAGGALTFILAGIAVLIISLVKKKHSEKQDVRTERA